MRYGDLRYGANLYGDSTEHKNIDPEPEGYTDLEKYIPQFIANMQEFHAWYVSQGYEVGREWAIIRSLSRQLFIETIDTEWGCSLWEKELDIKAPEDATIEQRVAAIRSKWISRQTCTPALVKQIAEDLTKVECDIVEEFSDYNFIIRFIGQYGVVRNAKALIKRIDEIKPAHLTYAIEYRYIIWRELAAYTWNDLSEYTWNGLRVWAHLLRVTWHGLNNASFSWRALSGHNWKTIKNIEEAKE